MGMNVGMIRSLLLLAAIASCTCNTKPRPLGRRPRTIVLQDHQDLQNFMGGQMPHRPEKRGRLPGYTYHNGGKLGKMWKSTKNALTLKQKHPSSQALMPLAPRLAHLAPQYSKRSNATQYSSQRPKVPNATGKSKVPNASSKANKVPTATSKAKGPNAASKATGNASLVGKHQATSRTAANKMPDTGGILSMEPDGRTMALLPVTGKEHHASALHVVQSANSTEYELLCAWSSGIEGDHGVSIAMSRLVHDDSAWQPPIIVAKQSSQSLQNPVWVQTNSGSLRLLFVSRGKSGQETSLVRSVISNDNGLTWSKSTATIAKRGAWVKNPPVQAEDGTILLPMYHTPLGLSDHKSQHSELMLGPSAHQGAAWKHGASMSKRKSGLVQPTIAKLGRPVGTGNFTMVAFFRSRKRDMIYRSFGKEGGRKWTNPTKTVLPNNNKSVQAITLGNGNLVLVFNNNNGPEVTKKTETQQRDAKQWPVSIALSEDGGETWPYVRDLEEWYNRAMEYSYPSVAESPDGRIHVTYTYSEGKRRRIAIRYISITENWIRGSYSWGSTKGVYAPSSNAAASTEAHRGILSTDPTDEDINGGDNMTGMESDLAAGLRASWGYIWR